jgi:hypothetical protein
VSSPPSTTPISISGTGLKIFYKNVFNAFGFASVGMKVIATGSTAKYFGTVVSLSGTGGDQNK